MDEEHKNSCQVETPDNRASLSVVYRITWTINKLTPFGRTFERFAGVEGNGSHKLVSAARGGGLLFLFHFVSGHKDRTTFKREDKR